MKNTFLIGSIIGFGASYLLNKWMKEDGDQRFNKGFTVGYVTGKKSGVSIATGVIMRTQQFQAAINSAFNSKARHTVVHVPAGITVMLPDHVANTLVSEINKAANQ